MCLSINICYHSGSDAVMQWVVLLSSLLTGYLDKGSVLEGGIRYVNVWGSVQWGARYTVGTVCHKIWTIRNDQKSHFYTSLTLTNHQCLTAK